MFLIGVVSCVKFNVMEKIADVNSVVIKMADLLYFTVSIDALLFQPPVTLTSQRSRYWISRCEVTAAPLRSTFASKM